MEASSSLDRPVVIATRKAFIGLSAAVVGWTAFVTTRPDAVAISYMFDDAFYYLVPAHAFAHGYGWTLDQLTRTSGFQLLYGYLCAVVSLAAGYTRALPIAMAWVSTAALLAAIWLALTRAGRLYGEGIAAAAVALTFAAPRAFYQMTSGLEWGLAVMMTVVLVVALLQDHRRRQGLAGIATAALFLGLTRADLAIFVAIFAAVVAWSRWHEQELTLREAAAVCGAAAGGTLAAGAITLLNSWAITGRWIPNSIAMKEFWSRSNAFQPAIDWNMIMSCTGPGALLTSLEPALGVRSRIPMAIFALVATLICRSEWRRGADRRALALASTAVVCAYTVAYARSVNLVFDHYSAGIVVPIALLTCGFLAVFGGRWHAAAVALAIGCGAVLIEGPWQNNPAHGLIARHAAALFSRAPAGSRVAGWNTGIAAWKTGGHVMNLDGLANASVVEPIKSGTLACFLSDEKIDYLMDFGYMFPGQIDTSFSKDEEMRRRLHIARYGYDSAALYRCVSVTAEADDDSVPNARYRLFGLNRPCVAALCPR